MTIDWQKVKKEATEYLSHLIQIDTSNPPGNEMKAIQFIKKIALQNGLYTEIQETAPNRGNILIRLTEKEVKNAPIILLSHVDVVPAHAEDWDVPPFSGNVINETLWGRGAIDAKQLTISHLMTLILLNRNQIKLSRDIVMIATSDEENGSKFGLLALLKKKPQLFHKAIVFNEGGGFPITINDKKYYLVEMGQKGTAHIQLTFSGKAELNSYMPDNSSMKEAAKAIEKFKQHSSTEEIPKIILSMFQKMSKDLGINIEQSDLANVSLDSFFTQIPVHLKSMFESMTKTTFSITKWSGGRQLAEAPALQIDCRPLPYVTKEKLQQMIDAIVSGLEVEITIKSFSKGFETPIDTEMLEIFEKELQREIPNVQAVPFLTIGANDARHLLSYESQVYGYCPMLPDMTFSNVIKMVHGVNEKIPIESLRFGIENMYYILKKLGG